MTATRTYYVFDGKKERLIRTTHPNRALAHAAESVMRVRVATQEDLELLLPAGVTVETARDAEPKKAPEVVPAEEIEPAGEA